MFVASGINRERSDVSGRCDFLPTVRLDHQPTAFKAVGFFGLWVADFPYYCAAERRGVTTSEAVGTGWSGERPTYSVMRIKVGISYLYFRKAKGKFASKSARHGVGMGGDKPIRTPIGLGFSSAQ